MVSHLPPLVFRRSFVNNAIWDFSQNEIFEVPLFRNLSQKRDLCGENHDDWVPLGVT
jgi:hypothetical protein